ncbi:MAG: hypothetical protein MJ234_03585 [bacterium]|nr:hypothetical protein [bacterium]
MDDFKIVNDSDSISTKVPFRIKSGSIGENSMNVEFSENSAEISFSDIEYICAGIIKDRTMSSAPPKTGVGTMLKNLFSTDKDKEEDQPIIQTAYLLDIYVKGIPVPYRINGSFVNYKSFLGKVAYASLENFKILIKKISEKSSCAVFNATAGCFLRGKPVKKFYRSELEFLVESSERRKASEGELSFSDVMSEELL